MTDMFDWKDLSEEALIRISDELCGSSSEEELEVRAAAYGVDLDDDQFIRACMYFSVIEYGMAPECCDANDLQWVLKSCPTREEWDQMWKCGTPEEARPWVEKFDIYNAETMLRHTRGYVQTDREHFMENITAGNNDIDPSKLLAALDDA